MRPEPLLYILCPDERTWLDGIYGRLEGPVELAKVASHLPKGSIIAVRPPAASPWQEVAEAIEAAAQRVVNASLAMWPDCLGRRSAVRFAARARLLGVRAVVWQPEPRVHQLRQDLTDPFDWPSSVVLWLQRRGLTLTPEVSFLLEYIGRNVARHRTFSSLVTSSGQSRGRWRRLFARDYVGPPGDWFQVLRVVNIGLTLQREPARRVIEIAEFYGFSGTSALSDRVNDVIGARPRYIRMHLGWPWMLRDALHRIGLRFGPAR